MNHIDDYRLELGFSGKLFQLSLKPIKIQKIDKETIRITIKLPEPKNLQGLLNDSSDLEGLYYFQNELKKSSTEARPFARLVDYGVDGKAKIESISLERIIIPNIYLVKEYNNQKVSVNSQMTVNFTKVDPTKYNTTIKNMRNSSFLVFSETFDNGWKIYGKDNAYLPESQHFLVNGYANAWLIDPKNTNGNDSSQLVIEYIPQRFFNIGIIISLIALSLCSVYGIYRYFRKRMYYK